MWRNISRSTTVNLNSQFHILLISSLSLNVIAEAGGMKLFNAVGVVARTDSKEALRFATKLVDHLKEKELSVFLEPKFAELTEKTDASLPHEKMNTDQLTPHLT